MDEHLVLAIVVSSSGSTPGKAGAKMTVRKNGFSMGTVGGGAVEALARKEAMEVLQTQRSCLKTFSLSNGQAANTGMICGGEITIFFQYISENDENLNRIFPQSQSTGGRREDGWLVIDLTDPPAWKSRFFPKDTVKMEKAVQAEQEVFPDICTRLSGIQKAGLFRIRERQYYAEPIGMDGTVYIFGGGHVAKELVPVLNHVGFHCVVVDDRKEFACTERFPQADQVITGDFKQVTDRLSIGSTDYVCIMTRGHEFDYQLQKQILPLKPRYLGIMGSRHKVAAVTKKLLADGFSIEEIQACHMPIGTRIGAETPAEIAISIAGEMILERKEKR